LLTGVTKRMKLPQGKIWNPALTKLNQKFQPLSKRGKKPAGKEKRKFNWEKGRVGRSDYLNDPDRISSKSPPGQRKQKIKRNRRTHIF